MLLLDHLLRRDRVVLGLAFRPSLPRHLLAAVDQRVQVDLAGRVDVELCRLAILFTKQESFFSKGPLL